MIEKLVNKANGTIADIITSTFYLIIVLGSFYSIINIIKVVNQPIILKPNPNLHGVLIILCLVTFYVSLLGKYYKKPSRRIIQYVVLVFGISVFSLNYLAETFNSLFINVLRGIKNIDIIPADLLVGNIRVVTLILPISIIIPLFILSIEVLKDKKSKDKLREYEVDLLLPSVHEFKDNTIDIEICKDIRTGLPCIVPEKIWYEHAWVQGGTGSGKTSNFILPFEEQLLEKKAYLTHKLKTIAYECLKNDIARINKPISNKWFNENFDMDLIEPKEGKEKEFYEAFKRHTIGIMKKEEIIYENDFYKKHTFALDSLKSDDYKYKLVLIASKDGMPYFEEIIEITKGNENIIKETSFIRIEIGIKSDDIIGAVSNDIGDKVNLSISEHSKKIMVNLVPTSNEYSYTIKAYSKGSGRLVTRDLGMTIVAPDGELVSKTVEISKEYGIKVHKIDPFMDEIKKGNVAKFNPLKGSSPEKIGDIVASILVSMDVGASNKSNPYFTNASVRAVRNLVILLKISYPTLYNREPTLVDVLSCLNNFDLVQEPVNYVRSNPGLMNQWRSVIDYFVTCFLEPPKDHSQESTSSGIGSQRKETQKAISGIINQLDNLLGREEIRYILCNEEESIDLEKVLRKGECIAISTRQGNLGARLGRAFALFFILSLQNEVLSRYAENENPEIPHFLIIDEFPMYCNESTETFFSFARKYKCSVTIAIQNMGQLKKVSDEFGETIFTNTTTKLLLPKANLEDRKYWSDFFGDKQEMQIMTGISTSSIHSENPSYNESIRGSLTETRNISEAEVDNLNFQQLYYSYVNKKGRKVVGKGTTEFLKTKKEPYMNEMFDFESYAINQNEYNKKMELENKIHIINKERELITIFNAQSESNDDPLFKDMEEITENLSELTLEDVIISSKENFDTPSPTIEENKKTHNLILVEELSNEGTTDQIIPTKEKGQNKNEMAQNIQSIEFLIFEEDERSK